MDHRRLEVAGLEALVAALRGRGYRVVGPTVQGGAIVYDDLANADDLPIGWTEVQAPGSYRLERRADAARFGFTVGPHAWKRFLLPPRLRLWRARRSDDGAFALDARAEEAPALAFVGVRPCDLRAIAIQDRVFTGGAHADTDYAARRERAFVVTVDCTEPAGTCFCASMDSGPAAADDFDLRLVEMLPSPARPDEHWLLAESGSERGAELLAELPTRALSAAEVGRARARVAAAADRMGRELDTRGLAAALVRDPEHPRWAAVAERCLDCGNCTLACPTCFCTSVEDTTDLTGAVAERTRSWASCFTLDYSYVHGGSVRASTRSRYRQWLTHKLSTWHAQFGTSGCTGCGRCIAWCPVGIDITEEARAVAGGAPEGGHDAGARS